MGCKGARRTDIGALRKNERLRNPVASAGDFSDVALSLEGTVTHPHFDRTAFKARVIYATLAPDGLTANIKFPIEEQEFRCEAQPNAYRPIPNKWGAAGWTTAVLSALTVEDLTPALTSAWRHQALGKTTKRRR